MVACKILIIDDDKDDIGVLAEALAKAGVNSIHYVFSAMQAFRYLEGIEGDYLPKLIIADLHLPGMTGTEFLKDLKAMTKYQHIPVIVLSSFKSQEEIEKYRQMGAADYVEKPCSYEEYVAVAEAMKRRSEEESHH